MKTAVIIGVVVVLVIVAVAGFIFFGPSKFSGQDYTIPELDLSVMPEELEGTEYEYLYNLSVVDDSKDYMAHPDSVLLKNGNIFSLSG